eukprot:Em0019g721a
MELADLVSEDLRLQPQQWELKPGVPGHLPELYCLVHENWLTSAKDGGPLPSCVPELDPTEVHWLLQPSCEGPPTKPWKRLYVACVDKSLSCADIGARARLPVTQGEGFSQHRIFQFLTQVAQENQLWSWKQLMCTLQGHGAANGGQQAPPPVGQLLPNSVVIRHIVKCLYGITVKQLQTNGTTSHRRDSPHGSNTPTSTPCHANFLKPEVVLESDRVFYFIYPYLRFTVFDLITHSPAVMQDSVTKSKMILFQLLTLLAHCHAQGVTLGDVTMWDLFVDARLWVQMGLPHSLFACLQASKTTGGTTTSVPPAMGTPNYMPPNLCLSEAVLLWKHGRMSNYDYLMFLNHLAGRRMGDPNNHPIMPWVMDFTSRNGGLRDLTKSKYRLEKGDDQLDYTYTSARDEAWRCNERDGTTPHHIGNISTDVTYYVYMARRTCREVLCSRVRPQWVPGEYPGSMERMYKWSPDECIPEFFTDPLLFKSIHPDLPDLAIPTWCGSPEELVSAHRGVLEGDHVSAHLHRWIDLMFGFQLGGEAAYKSKNVYLTLVDNHTSLHCSGVVQLFRSSHPKRAMGTCAPLALLEWQTFLAQSSVAVEAGFDTQQVEKLAPKGEEGGGVEGRDAMAPPTGDDTRTLETIISEQSKQVSVLAPPGGEGVLEDSFEHVAPDELIMEGTTPTDIFLSNRMATIDYGMSPSDVDQGKAVLNVVMGQNRPIASWLRQHKKLSMDSTNDHHAQHVEDVQENHKTTIAFPKGTKMNANLASLEEVMHFVMKSCRQAKEVFKTQWEIKDLTLLKNSDELHSLIDLLRFREENPLVAISFSQRVAIDVAAVTCTMVEICMNKQLRAAIPARPSLYQRASTILEMRKSGMLQLPVHLGGLLEYVFAPESDRGLPELSPTLLLQQFVTIVPFPSYFGTLCTFFSEVEQLCRKCSLNSSNLKSFPRPKTDFETPPTSESSAVVTFVQERLPTLLPLLDKDGQGLLLLHLVPLFHFPETCFEATIAFIDQIGQYLPKKRMEQLFLMAVLRTYDMAVEPYQKVQLFSRPVVDTILSRFGLTVFLHRFLGFVLDVVVDPSALTSKHGGSHYTTSRPLEKALDYTAVVMAEFAYSMSDKLPSDDADNDEDSDVEVEVEGEGEIPKMSLLLSCAPPTGTPVMDEEAEGGEGVQQAGGNGPPMGTETPAVTIVERKNTGPFSTKEQKPTRERTTSRQAESGSGVLGKASASTPSKGLPGSKVSTAAAVVTAAAPSIGRVQVSNQRKEGGTKRRCLLWSLKLVGTIPLLKWRQKLAIENSVAEVVTDTLCWLVRRFGPLLATRYIIKPLRDNLYRSFVGLKSQRAMAIRCLKAFAIQTNADAVPLKLYLPFAEDLVSAATNKMNSRAEAGLAASLALVKISVETTKKTDKNFAKRLCDTYFIPLIQLISSHVSFPSGAPGRAAICHGTVLVLQQLAKGVVEECGREGAMDVMQGTLQSFFNCFGVFQQRRESGHLKAKSPTPLGDEADDVCSQLCRTFNDAMANAAYVPFCLILGQINVGKLLSKKDLVEQMAYSYDEVKHKSALPCVFHTEDYSVDDEETSVEDKGSEEVEKGSAVDKGSSDDEKGSDDEENVQEEAAFRLGPMGSIHAIKKLDKQATSFGRSNWFVELNEVEGEAEKPGEGAAIGDVTKGGEGMEVGTGTLKRSGDRVSITSWRLKTFRAAVEDTSSEGVPCYPASTLSSAAFEEKYKYVFAQMEKKKNKKSPGRCEDTNMPDSERYFVSSGKDKLSSVKLWTMHSLLLSPTSVLPTQEYKHKNVFAVELLDQVQQLVTCDGSICFNFQKNYRVAAMAMVSSPQPAICTATADGTLRFIDLRSKSIACSWKTTIVGGLCSSIATHDNWVVVGTDTGLVCCSDLRMGEPLNSWKLTETPNTAPWGDSLVRLKATKRGRC